MRRTSAERGSTLLVATTLIALMFVGATSVLMQIAHDNLGDGIYLGSQKGVFVAEAGLVAGSDALRQLLYPTGNETSPVLSNLTALGALSAGDGICQDDTDCTVWYPLPLGTVPYGGGNYRTAASCVPNSCTSQLTVTAVRLRSLATLPPNTSHLLESLFSTVTP